MMVCEVMETKTAYKPNQKDDDGNVLPLGSIQVRVGSSQSNIGQVRNIYARPATFQRRIPLIGETVMVIAAPSNDWSSTKVKNSGYYYFSPLNTTDDLTLHVFPQLFKRSNNVGGGSGGQRNHDKEKWGYTFPSNPKQTFPIQPFDGDDIFEGRTGQSIRFGTTVEGDMSVYSEKPTWKGSTKNDPLTIIRVAKPTGGSGNKFTIEDINKDDSSIYLTSTQMLSKLKGGFDKNLDIKKLATYKTTPQIVINSGRVVINAKDDMLCLVGKDKAILTGKKVILQSDKYKVDLDELIDYIKKHVDLDADLAQGSAMYATPAGPTATATSLAQFIKLKTADFQKFKLP